MKGRRTALIVAVPEAEAAVGELRLHLDPAARLGVPAHVSILFPFVPAAQIDDRVLSRVADVFSATPSFEYGLVRSQWFGDRVLWLAPDTADEFRTLTGSIWHEFPAYSPYEGKFEDVVPHLTIGDRGPTEAMRAAEREIQGQLPIQSVVRAATLMVERESGRWEPVTSFALGDPATGV